MVVSGQSLVSKWKRTDRQTKRSRAQGTPLLKLDWADNSPFVTKLPHSGERVAWW